MESALRTAANVIRTSVGIVIGLMILALYLPALTAGDGTINTRNEVLILIVVALLAAMLVLPLLGMAVDTVCRLAEWRGWWARAGSDLRYALLVELVAREIYLPRHLDALVTDPRFEEIPPNTRYLVADILRWRGALSDPDAVQIPPPPPIEEAPASRLGAVATGLLVAGAALALLLGLGGVAIILVVAMLVVSIVYG